MVRRKSSDLEPSESPPTAEEKDECAPAKEVRFAFGPNGQYFLALSEAKSHRYAWSLAVPTENHVSELEFGGKLYTAAIMADGGIFVAYTNDDERPCWMQSHPTGQAAAFEVAYRTLYNKILKKNQSSSDDLSYINLTLGPNGSYFTNTKDGAMWRDLPAGLETEIEEYQKEGITPRQVALGRKDSYICLWSNDRWSYQTNGNFKGLKAKFDQYKKTGEKIAFAALDPYDTDSWMLVGCDGLIASSLKGMSNKQLDRIQEIIVGYMQRRARKTGITFTNCYSRGSSGPETLFGKLSTTGSWDITITPETKFDEAAPPLQTNLMDPLKTMRARLMGGPEWRPPLLAAGIVGLSTGAVCRYANLSIKPAVVAGAVAGFYVHGYLTGLSICRMKS